MAVAVDAPRAVPNTDDTIRLRQRLDRRLAELRLDRAPAEADWHDITRLILPKRGRYIVLTGARKPRGASKAILDPTATKAHGRLAAFCQAGITNPALPWLHLGVADDDVADDDDVRAYCAECTRRVMRVLSEGTFYQALHQTYEELGGFATGAILMLSDFEDVVRFYPLTTGEYFLALDARQEVDTLYREYSVSVAQLVEQFGRENCSPSVQSEYDAGRLSGPVVVVHAIEPNRDRKRGRIGWQTKPYIGVYYERGATQGILKAEGFDHRPFIAPRWSALANEPYGSGPGHEALPDVKSLQAGVRQLTEAAEKLLNPPLQGDARHQNLFMGQLPGDINWIQGLDNSSGKDPGLRPIFTVPPNIQPLAAEVDRYRKTVEATFYNDLILAISQMEGVQPRNQLEIQERRQEKMLQLGPMLERFYTEALTPVVRFVFAEMQRVRLLPRPPASLHGRMIEPRFVSVLAQAQKSVGTTSIENLLRLAGSMVAAWPGVVQKVDADALIDQYAELTDVPEHIVLSQAAVDAKRQEVAKQQQNQQALQNAQSLAQTAQTLSQTDVGGGQNAVSAMLGRPGGPAQ